MRQKDVAILLSDMDAHITEAINDAHTAMTSRFSSDAASNAVANKEAHVHNLMADYLITSQLHSRFKKAYDYTKKHLDKGLIALYKGCEGIPGTTTTLHSDNIYHFDKRQNVDGECTLVVDLVTALSRSGVEKDIIDAALKQATKPKRGNVYYEIKLMEE